MDEILAYLKEKHKPIGMIVYGSFADGSNNMNSDFDAFLINKGNETLHDHSFVNGTELDVFIYPKSFFEKEYDINDFLQVWDGKIIIDETGIAHEIKEEACCFIRNYTGKTKEENELSLAWCEKMLLRTTRNDMEGLYRLHWLLVDSLEIYFDLKGLFYFGPKKAIRHLSLTDPESSEVYCRALKEPTEEHVADWVLCLKKSLMQE